MTVFDPFYKDNVDVGDVCCGEKPQKPREPKVHAVPGLLTPAPDWSGIAIVESKIRKISLKDYKGKYLILFFYPYDFTFICPTEMIQFNDRIEEFDKLGTFLISLSFTFSNLSKEIFISKFLSKKKNSFLYPLRFF